MFYNSNCIFACSTFQQRYDWLKIILNTFHSKIDGLSIFLHKSEIPKETRLRGYEIYTEEIGKHGFFVENDTSVTVLKSSIPDVYTVENDGGYLKVPSIEISEFLRSKGDKFNIKCEKLDDGSWVITENIPGVK